MKHKHKYEILSCQMYGQKYISGMQKVCLDCEEIKWMVDRNGNNITKQVKKLNKEE